MRKPFDPNLTARTEIVTSQELPFRLRTVARLKAGLSEPFAHEDFDPYLRDRRPVATVCGTPAQVKKAWAELAKVN
jgi:hypothetical protein